MGNDAQLAGVFAQLRVHVTGEEDGDEEPQSNAAPQKPRMTKLASLLLSCTCETPKVDSSRRALVNVAE